MILDEVVESSELDLKDIFKHIDEVCFINSEKVLNAFHKNKVSETHFYSSSGYGYNDIGREVIEKIYSNIFESEDALVRSQIISGTHAITVSLFGLLRPGDTMLSITGKPYDTLDEVIGIKENNSSLKSFNVNYEEINLVNNDFDYESIEKRLKLGFVKLIHIQISKGYSTRDSLNIDLVEKVIKFIKNISKDTIIFVDNCYCEFVDTKEPIEVGADLVAGSLIKNLGGGIATNGGYIVGTKDLVLLCSEHLNVPGQAKEVGPNNMNKQILQGLYMAPSVVASSLKTVVFASYLLEKLGYEVNPKYNDKRVDIVENIKFNSKEKLIKFIQGIQKGSAIDSFALPQETDMPGYTDKIIMASGSFTQGSSIEISCDGPVKSPYIAYLQGGLTFEYGKLAVLKAINEII